jgi:cytochrome c-type biogenesis protein CcmF
LAAWGHSTVKTLGRAIWKPLAASLVILVLAFVVGARHPLSLLAFWLIGYAGAVIVYEFGRAALARSRQTGENLLLALNRLVGKNRRRYGGALIHLAIVLMALGVIGIEMFQTQTQGSIPQGKTLKLGNYDVVYAGLKTTSSFNSETTTATINILRNGRSIGTIHPSRAFYFDSGQTVTMPGLHSTMEDDVYVVLVDWETISTQGATFKVYRNPLVNWLWVGAVLLVAGTFVAGWPQRERVI